MIKAGTNVLAFIIFLDHSLKCECIERMFCIHITSKKEGKIILK